MTEIPFSTFLARQVRANGDVYDQAQPWVLACADALDSAGLTTASFGDKAVVVYVRPSLGLAVVSPYLSEQAAGGVKYFFSIYHTTWGDKAKEGYADTFAHLVASLKREVEGLT